MKYTESHEWVDASESVATVGVSIFAQEELGDIVYVELPEVGRKVSAGEDVAVLESTKAAADVYSPVSGEIAEINEKLKESPDLINSSPESDGWIFKVAISDKTELDRYMDKDQYQAQFQS